MLPDELTTEVLLRLPVKSILRFRAVCRSWAAELSSEDFCSLHMARSEAKAAAADAPPKLIFISPTASFDSTRVYSGSSSGPSDGLLFTLNDVRGDFADLTPVPCRGLTLLHDLVAPAYYVFNAATRAVTRLPPCQDVVASSTAGLGFDARTKEYKVVRLSCGNSDEKQRIKCEVYALGGEHGDRWRAAAGGVPFRFCNFASAAVATVRWSERKLRPVFADGFLHWLIDPATLLTRPRAAVLSFSVEDEKFRWIRSPPFEVSRSRTHLVEIAGHLCMVQDYRPHGSVLDIWEMKGYSSAGEWSLRHSIDLLQHVERDLVDPQVIRVIGSVGDNKLREKVILVTSKRKVITYDPVSGVLKTILSVRETSSSYETERYAPRVSLFKETLAPVRKTNEEIAMSSPLAKAAKEILFRLPGDFAVQLKLVSKFWLRLIGTESFTSSYYAHNNMSRRPKIMLVGSGARGLGFSFVPLRNLLGEAPSQGTWLDTKVVCSKPCHGMNLISTEMEDYLYNPCNGYRHSFRTRDPLCDVTHDVLVMMRGNAWTSENHAFSVGNKNAGLGFNMLTQEHVIVQAFYHVKDFTSRNYFLTCSVITLGSAQDNFEPPLPLNGMPPAYLSGGLYWMSEPRLGQSYKRAIVSFHIPTRSFSIIPCPPCVAMWNDASPCEAFVVELEGTLCAVLADPVAEELDVWKLEHDRWDRAYKVYLKGWLGYSRGANVVMPLAVDPKDGRILLNTGRKLGLYDPGRRTIEKLYDLDEVLRLEHQQTFFQELPNSQGKHGSVQVPWLGENPLDSKILPFVPLLYEDSLASYPRAYIARRLR